jgi:hypothetical protein
MLNVAIAVIFALISAYIIPYLRLKIGTQNYDKLVSLVQTAVAAAEQIYRGVQKGAEKKAYVQDWLAKRNIMYDRDEIDAVIEAEVLKLNSKTVE